MAEGEKVVLRPGMRVQFREVESDDKNNTHAEEVKCVDGTPISWWKKCGLDDRELYEEEHEGIIGEFRYKDGYGYILPSAEVSTQTSETLTLCEKLHCRREDFVVEGDKPALNSGRKVKFKLYKDTKGFGATRITDPEGKPIGKAEKRREVSPSAAKKRKIDPEERYQGRVLMFKVNKFGFLTSKDDLTEMGVTEKLYFQAADIDTAQRPAQVAVGQEVSFTLYEDDKGLGAKNVGMPDGTPVVVPDERRHKPYKEIMPRESIDGEYLGKVVKFIWDKGFGYIKVDSKESPIPEEHAVETMRSTSTGQISQAKTRLSA
eukprot:TRINITY_DN147_c0_g2_i1.p1 TRINITY_DN147_c0_g2~~TRINITY_DN147_c0_g2_i1.p1  ORF type:complete len:366 (-),score=87.65 TRINITY_DN147_c0_g2_i1:325-1278(-)